MENKAIQQIISDVLASFSGKQAEKEGLEKFVTSLSHKDLPAGWQDNPAIVDAAAKMYQQGGTESPFFKAWFGNSKVVDERGEPLPVYHGSTSAPFTSFDGKQFSGGTLSDGLGNYFSSDKDVARTYTNSGFSSSPEIRLKTEEDIRNWVGGDTSYRPIPEEKKSLAEKWFSRNVRSARENKASPNIVEAFLKIENPSDIDYSGKKYSDIIEHEGKTYGKRGMFFGDMVPSSNEIVSEAHSTGRDGAILKNIIDPGGVSSPNIVEMFKKSGKYDFTRTPFRVVADDYVVFDPSNIKSVANRGTFDPSDPNILRGIGIGAAGLGAGAAAMAPSQSEAALPNAQDRWKQYDALVKAGLLKEEQGLEEPVWSPIDLPAAAVGVPGGVAKALAMALDAPLTIAGDYALDKAKNIGKHIDYSWLYQ